MCAFLYIIIATFNCTVNLRVLFVQTENKIGILAVKLAERHFLGKKTATIHAQRMASHPCSATGRIKAIEGSVMESVPKIFELPRGI